MRNQAVLKLLKNPIVWLGILMISYNVINRLSKDNLKSVVFSDGSGYYAYLPSILIYNDPTFQKSVEAENKYKGQDFNPIFIFKDKQGNFYNKYYPGIAILQLPFFCVACLFSWLAGLPLTGYSDLFSFFYMLGSTFYSVAGIFLFYRFYRNLFPALENSLKWIILVFVVATPLLFYCLETSYAHNFSFFLFGLFADQLFKLKTNQSLKQKFIIGLIIGLIVLVRPTNLIILLMVPFILGSKINFIQFLKSFFQDRSKPLFALTLGFFCIFSLIVLVWKWESGNWFIWSYAGEGFNFLSPQLFECLFGFRVGLFLQIPIMIITVIGTYFLFKSNPFRFVIWFIYFSSLIWIFASWWCWDFYSTFGSRAYTEHLFFLLIPIVSLFSNYRKFVLIALCFFVLTGAIRFLELKTGYMHNQRFTKENYFESLLFWKKENKGRWNCTKACKPFGTKIMSRKLLNEPNILKIGANDEFIYPVETVLKKPRTNERFYYKVQLEKKLINSQKTESVYLVADLWNKDGTKRSYISTELFIDKFEAKTNWAKISFEGELLDNLQEYDFIKMYIWNQSRSTLYIKNATFCLQQFKSK
jgi:hypothetical protein